MIQQEILTSFINVPFYEFSIELPITNVLHVQLLRISTVGVKPFQQSLPHFGAGKALPNLTSEGHGRNMAANVAQVRFVRCPKCWQVLPEPNIPVYRCGGCNSFLRAKRPGESSRSRTAKTNPEQNNEVAHAYDGNESIVSNQQLTVCPTDAHISDTEHPVECETSGNGDDRDPNALPSPNEFDQCDREHSATIAVQREELSGSEREDSNHRSPLLEEKYNENEERHSEVESAIVPNCCIQSKADDSSALHEHEKISQPPEQHGCDMTSPRDEKEEGELPIHCKKISEDKVDTNLGGAVGNLSKSPTRSSHAYDASISSCGDILDEHVLIRHQNQSSNSGLKPPNTKLRSNREGIHAKGKMIIDSEMKNYKAGFSSNSLNEYGLANGESSNWNHDDSSKPVRKRFQAPEPGSVQEADVFHSVKSWMESERDGSHRYPLSRDSSYQWEPHRTYENGGPSSYRHEELLTSPSSYASDKLDYLEKDRIELLKKVEELRDQLSRSYEQRGKGKEKLPIRSGPQENPWPSSYGQHHLRREPLPHYNMNYLQNHNQPYIPRNSMLHQYGPPQMPFSRQPTSSQLHYDRACLHCCCESRQFPTHSSATAYSRTGTAQVFPRHSGYYSFSSTPSQPQLHQESGFSQHHRVSYPHERGLVSHDIEKPQQKERRQPVKRHCLPVADGAPFIICNRCWNVLQLPADFLLSKKGRHKLLCGRCSKLLTFSLRRGICKATSTSHIDGILQGDRVSYSDDYGVSISKSYSTEQEPMSFASIHLNRSGWNDRYQRGSSSIKPQTDERQARVISERSEAPEDPNESPQSEGSLDVNRASSPLHRLMGYSSVSEVLYGPKDLRIQQAEWE